MSLPLARIISTALATLFLVAITLKTLFPGDDPYRCRAVKDTGRWIDPPRDEEGNRNPFHQWQPDGCILHHYKSGDVRRCTEGRRIVVVGDSTSRNVAHGFGRLIDRKHSNHDREAKKMPKSQAFNMTYHGQLIQRLPNAWLSSHGTEGQEQFAQALDIYAEEKQSLPSIEDQEGPMLMYVAGGVWFTNEHSMIRKYELELAANATAAANMTNSTDATNKTDVTTGQTSKAKTNRTSVIPWEERFEIYKEHISKIEHFISEHAPDYDPFTATMDPIDGLGNQIFYAPPAGPLYLGDNTGHIRDADRRAAEVIEMQDWLSKVEEKWKIPLVWSIPRLTFGQKKVWIDPLFTGLHVKSQVADTRANILLNLRCNAKLDRMKSYPYSRTCCTDYGVKPMSQLGVIFAGIVYLVACIVCEIIDICVKRDEPRWSLWNMRAGSLVLALLMCYYADRTQMMAKGSKLWLPLDFAALVAPCISILLVTIRRSYSLPPNQLALAINKPDEPFLSRFQTDEWKGWMQFFILIYHWTGSRSGSIYIFIRLCVGAYLFQTGYGHTLYFIKKRDFSFNRVAAVLLRLNLLSCILAYFMDTDYMFYYFSPLVSFWFLVVYTTMVIGSQQYNSDPQILLAKICISCFVVSTILLKTPFTKWIFSLLKVVFNIQWSGNEWQYRITLDMFIVYVGMITAVVNHEMKKTTIQLGLRIILAVGGFFTVGYYFNATSHMTMKEYRKWHPLVSFIPVLAFIALRNISAPIRNYHSKAMAWLGRCSLETYILQFHLLLAADTNGVLIVDGFFGDGTFTGDRWRTLAVIVPIFLWTSDSVAKSTAHIVNIIMDDGAKDKEYEEPRYAWMEKLHHSEYFTWPQLRVACILLVMWLLNLVSPGHETPQALDGGHTVKNFPPPIRETPY
ncbi:uncharacterized protein FTOL_10631 [Fusarium torulosum]|uniref:Cas1p 10 TM acyl transferase domain-containing protein n=1 Tax=Fusarium torulosum TaxID=33205 RepID=A0AAE8SM74_9HYPO|nr:uncharacterized protein FTOL_10631 [Fusarium torulosum]